jgi:glycosyltransferase involved in cell wall biosynthesis
MTVYNRQDYLTIALDSICQQTYPHWQLVVWDDGSSDASPAIARAYAERDPRIHCIATAHKGRAYALRAAIAESLRRGSWSGRSTRPAMEATQAAALDSPYLGWVDSDDILAPNALAATASVLDTHPQIGMVYTDHTLIDERGTVLGLGSRCQIPYSPERLLIDFMTFHFRLMRRNIYDRVGGIDIDFPQAQDYDLCLKIAEVTKVYHLCQSHYYYRVHERTIGNRSRTAQTERSATAVRNALIRRGASERYELEVSRSGRFTIKDRQ